MVQHSHKTLVRKWRTGKVWRALLAGPLASLVLKYHTETAFCSGSISYLPRGIMARYLHCIRTNDARWSYCFNKYFLLHHRRRHADLLAHSGQGAAAEHRVQSLRESWVRKSEWFGQKAVCKPPLCNIQYNGLRRFGRVLARWWERKTRTGAKCHK